MTWPVSSDPARPTGDAPRLGLPAKIAAATYLLTSCACIALLVLHTLRVAGTQVDTTSLGLLALLLIVPLAPYITRLKAAGVEAEIGPRDAQQLRASAVAIPAAAEPEPNAGVLAIQDLTASDPPLGLAKLRIELEDELRRLCTAFVPDAILAKWSPGLMVQELRGRGVINRDVAEPLATVITLANRAIHGEYVPPDVASEIADVGLRLLEVLNQLSA